jgi:hypothetical protein
MWKVAGGKGRNASGNGSFCDMGPMYIHYGYIVNGYIHQPIQVSRNKRQWSESLPKVP